MPSVEQVLVFYLSILVLTHNNHFTIIRMTLKFQPRNFWSNLSNSLLRLRTETHLKMGLYMYSRGSKYTGSLHKIRFHSLENTDPGKDWGQEENGVTEDEMVGWNHQLNGHGFEQTLGDSEGQGSLVCCISWGHKGWDMTYQPSNNNNKEEVFLR